jgi:hypothetical protein
MDADARNDGERRGAVFATAVSCLAEGKVEAIGEIEKKLVIRRITRMRDSRPAIWDTSGTFVWIPENCRHVASVQPAQRWAPAKELAIHLTQNTDI